VFHVSQVVDKILDKLMTKWLLILFECLA
jgi:hypothetical protein